MQGRPLIPSYIISLLPWLTLDIHILCTDNAMEYKRNKKFLNFFLNNATLFNVHVCTTLQNDHAKCKHHYALDTVRTLPTSLCPGTF